MCCTSFVYTVVAISNTHDIFVDSSFRFAFLLRRNFFSEVKHFQNFQRGNPKIFSHRIMISSEGFVAFFVTIVWFFLEALVHYNIGKTGSCWITSFPHGEELVLILTSIAICSFLSTVTTNFITGILKVIYRFSCLSLFSLSLLSRNDEIFLAFSEKQSTETSDKKMK